MLTVDKIYEVIINVVLTIKEFITWLYAQIIWQTLKDYLKTL